MRARYENLLFHNTFFSFSLNHFSLNSITTFHTVSTTREIIPPSYCWCLIIFIGVTDCLDPLRNLECCLVIISLTNYLKIKVIIDGSLPRLSFV